MMLARRLQICVEDGIGLTVLYNRLDEGAYRELRESHDVLDETVIAAYDWSPRPSNAGLQSALLAPNIEVADGIRAYHPFLRVIRESAAQGWSQSGSNR